SFFFHSFVNLQHLKTIVEGMKRQGYRFVSLKSFGCRTSTHNRVATTDSGLIRLTFDHEYLRTLSLDSHEEPTWMEVSQAPLSGLVEKNTNVESGRMMVYEGLSEKPTTK